MLSTFYIKPLNILITVILNSLSNNSKVYVVSESGFDDWFISLPSNVSWNFGLKAVHVLLNNRNW